MQWNELLACGRLRSSDIRAFTLIRTILWAVELQLTLRAGVSTPGVGKKSFLCIVL